MRKYHWLEVLVVLALIVLAVVACLSAVPGLRSEVAAAWAQGLLTAAGLFLALYIANYQAEVARRQLREQRQEDLDGKRAAVRAVAAVALEVVEKQHEAFLGSRLTEYIRNEYRPKAIEYAEGALRSVPLHELESYRMAEGIMELVDALANTREGCAYMKGILERFPAHEHAAIFDRFYKASQEPVRSLARMALLKVQAGANGWSDEEFNRRVYDHVDF